MEYKKEKVSSLMGHTEVRYESGMLKLAASPMGVELKGMLTLQNPAELEMFAKMLSDAWKSHLTLKPKIVGLGEH